MLLRLQDEMTNFVRDDAADRPPDDLIARMRRGHLVEGRSANCARSSIRLK